MEEYTDKQGEVALIGSVVSSSLLHSYYLYQVKDLTLKGLYIKENDFVFTGDFVSDTFIEEEEEFESLPKQHLDKVFYFDTGVLSDMDLAIMLSEYIIEGVQCVVFTEICRKCSHDLITLVQVEIPEIV